MLHTPANLSKDSVVLSLINGQSPILQDAYIHGVRFDRQKLTDSANASTFVDCQFSKCDLREFQVFGSKFLNCVFEQTKLEVFGAWDSDGTPSCFRNCSFIWKNIRKLAFGGVLDGCRMDGTMTGCSFRSSVIDTTFSGKLIDCEFGGRVGSVPLDGRHVVLTRCDFSEVKIFDVEFNDVFVEDCKFPDLACFAIVNGYSAVLSEIISILERYSIRSEGYIYQLRRSGGRQRIGVLNLNWVEKFVSQNAAKAEVLAVIEANRLQAPG